MISKELGAFGEKIVIEYLKKKGYRVLAKNYSVSFSSFDKGEIDIIARKDGVISFVEVKTTVGLSGSFSPEQRADYRKQRKLVKLSQIWLEKNKLPLDTPWQIDVVGVRIDRQSGKAEISHFENVISG